MSGASEDVERVRQRFEDIANRYTGAQIRPGISDVLRSEGWAAVHEHYATGGCFLDRDGDPILTVDDADVVVDVGANGASISVVRSAASTERKYAKMMRVLRDMPEPPAVAPDARLGDAKRLIEAAVVDELDAFAALLGVPPRRVIAEMLGEPIEDDDTYRKRVLHKAGF